MRVVARLGLLLLFLVAPVEARSGMLHGGLPYVAEPPVIEDRFGQRYWTANVTVTNPGNTDATPHLDFTLYFERPVRSPDDNSLLDRIEGYNGGAWVLEPGASHTYSLERRIPADATISQVAAFPQEDCSKTGQQILDRLVQQASYYPRGADEVRNAFYADYSQDDSGTLQQRGHILGCQRQWSFQTKACMDDAFNDVAVPPARVSLEQRQFTDSNGEHFEADIKVVTNVPVLIHAWSEDARVTSNGGGSAPNGCLENTAGHDFRAQRLDGKLHSCLVNGAYHVMVFYSFHRIEHYELNVTEVLPHMQCGAPDDDSASLAIPGTNWLAPLLAIVVAAVGRPTAPSRYRRRHLGRRGLQSNRSPRAD